MSIVPAFTSEDHLPDEQAVWRDEVPAPATVAGHKVSVELGDGGLIERTVGAMVDWPRVTRWRFGWPSHQPGSPFDGLGLAAKE